MTVLAHFSFVSDTAAPFPQLMGISVTLLPYGLLKEETARFLPAQPQTVDQSSESVNSANHNKVVLPRHFLGNRNPLIKPKPPGLIHFFVFFMSQPSNDSLELLSSFASHTNHFLNQRRFLAGFHYKKTQVMFKTQQVSMVLGIIECLIKCTP
jgi:hypothetical protein